MSFLPLADCWGEYALLAIERRPSFPSETLPLLDIDAVAKALLALD